MRHAGFTRFVALMIGLGAGATMAPEALAQPQTAAADEAEAAFQLGNRAYLAGDFRQALFHYFMSNRIAPNRKVIFNIARCYEELGAFVEAYRYYQSHQRSLAPGDAEGKESAAALARLESKVALVEVVSEPPGATVFIDRRDLGAYGQTPLLLALPAGRYNVLLDKPGWVSTERAGVAATVATRARVEASLQKIVGRIDLAGSPEGAEVTLEESSGEVVKGALPGVLTAAAGQLVMTVRHPGHVTQQRVVRVEADQTTPVEVRLEREVGSLVVAADETGAVIRVDGEPVGFTPAVIDRIPIGTHELTVELEGFQTWSRVIELAAGQRLDVYAAMIVPTDVEAASRAAESVFEAPASVSVIPRLEIEAFDYPNLQDALLGTRGVYLTDNGAYHAVGFRGFSPYGDYSNRVQIQLDGHTLNDDWLGQGFTEFDNFVGLHHLERIEIVRGPGSTLHGSGAIFGVINMVTPDRVSEREVRLGTAIFGPGTFGAWTHVKAPLGDDAGIWAYAGYANRQSSDYFSPARVGSEEAPDGIAHDVGGADMGSVTGKAYVGDVSLLWHFNQRDRQVATAWYDTTFGDPSTNVLDRRAFAELRYEPSLGEGWDMSARLSWDHYYFDSHLPYGEEDGTLRETYGSHWLTLDTRFAYTPSELFRVTFGLEYQFHPDPASLGESLVDGEAYLDESQPFHRFATYALADLDVVDWLSLAAGLRFDAQAVSGLPNEDFTGEVDKFIPSLSPRFVAKLRPADDHIVKLMVGTAFRAPSLYEYTYSDLGLTSIASPGVKPERIITSELEYLWQLSEDVLLNVGAFFSVIQDHVTVIGDGESEPFQYSNLEDDVLSTGFEVELRREFRRGLMVAANYAFQQTRVRSLSSEEELPNSPPHLFGARLVAPIVGRELGLATRLAIESPRRTREGDHTDAAVLWDIGLHGRLTAANLDYSLSVQNALDWDYEHPVGDEILDTVVPARPFAVKADISVRF